MEEDAEFLKLVIYKHLFSHVDMFKSYSSNKLNDGLYGIGYYESLGNVNLKRFLLFFYWNASSPCSISMCAVARRKILMLQVKLAVAGFPRSFVMCLFQNRAHGTSSRYKLETTNHHGQGFLLES